MNNLSRNSGFTLIELMVAIVLGLLITAAAVQLFTGGLVSTRIQQANAEIQDSGIFGLELVAKDIRLANYGNIVNTAINDTTAWGGIVLTANSSSSTANKNLPTPSAAPFIADTFLTHSAGTSPAETVSTNINEWNGFSNVKIGANNGVSDQLTIQYIAPAATTNCEGANVQAGDYVIQRYFLRRDPASATTGTDYALACDANTPTATGTAPVGRPTSISGFGDAGQVLIPHVDHLKFQLGVRNASNNLVYYSINQYRAAANTARAATPVQTAPSIIAVKIGILIRSTDNTRNRAINLSKSIDVLQDAAVPIDTANQFARRVYTTTVALRNATGG